MIFINALLKLKSSLSFFQVNMLSGGLEAVKPKCCGEEDRLPRPGLE